MWWQNQILPSVSYLVFNAVELWWQCKYVWYELVLKKDKCTLRISECKTVENHRKSTCLQDKWKTKLENTMKTVLLLFPYQPWYVKARRFKEYTEC